VKSFNPFDKLYVNVKRYVYDKVSHIIVTYEMELARAFLKTWSHTWKELFIKFEIFITSLAFREISYFPAVS
jgi:hypothetical protein